MAINDFAVADPYFEIMLMGANPTFSATMPARQPKKGGGSPANVARVRRVAIIAVPPARMLDVVGPAEVFTDANKLRGSEPAYEVEIAAAAEDGPFRARSACRSWLTGHTGSCAVLSTPFLSAAVSGLPRSGTRPIF